MSAVAVVPLDAKRRRTYRGEERWFGLLEELGHSRLRRALIESGVSAAQAGGLVFFIEDQMTLERHQDQKTRSRHRRILAGLDPGTVRSRAMPGLLNRRSLVA